MNPYGQQIDRSHSGGLNLRAFYAVVFAWNEDRWKKGKVPLTDERIACVVREAFPCREWGRGHGLCPSRYRTEYNRTVSKKQGSGRYVEDMPGVFVRLDARTRTRHMRNLEASLATFDTAVLLQEMFSWVRQCQ